MKLIRKLDTNIKLDIKIELRNWFTFTWICIVKFNDSQDNNNNNEILIEWTIFVIESGW